MFSLSFTRDILFVSFDQGFEFDNLISDQLFQHFIL